YSFTKRTQIAGAAGVFGNEDTWRGCTIGSMIATPHPARLQPGRVRSGHPSKRRVVRGADEFRTTAHLAGEDTTLTSPSGLALRRLANLLASYTPYDGAFQLRLPGTWAIRVSRTATEASYATLGP